MEEKYVVKGRCKMAKCSCIYCENDYEESNSTAVESTVYCTATCERDDNYEGNEDN